MGLQYTQLESGTVRKIFYRNSNAMVHLLIKLKPRDHHRGGIIGMVLMTFIKLGNLNGYQRLTFNWNIHSITLALMLTCMINQGEE